MGLSRNCLILMQVVEAHIRKARLDSASAPNSDLDAATNSVTGDGTKPYIPKP